MNYIIAALFISISFVCAENPIVETSHGKISGQVFKTLLRDVEYYAFMGIPYAAPPVKSLRFLPPRPIDPWDDVLPATKEKQECIQFNQNIKKGEPLGHYGVEDCLYLDIFTPALDSHRRPVIVFLFNEHFRYSYNKTTDYAPDFFIEDDTIIATITHRLSVFGFLSLEDGVLSGNAGLKDIVAGLEWIRDNVERFGGDANRITLMGSQGGAVAVDLLMHSNAKKLITSVILQSGSSFSSMYLQDSARKRALKLADLFERGSSNSNQVLKELVEIPAEDLLRKELDAIPEDYGREQQRGLLAFGPTVERPGGLVIEYPEQAEGIDIPVMIGFNSREGMEKAFQYLIEPKYLSFVDKDFVLILPRRVDYTFNPLDETYYEAVDDIKKFYFPKGKVRIKNVPEYITYMGDIMTEAIDYSVRFYSNITSSEVYYYHFDYYSDLNENKNDIMKLSTVEDGTWGAVTGDELCYLFKCPRLKKKYLQYNTLQSEEIIMLRKMVRMWVNFAKYGNPTPKDDSVLDGLHWPVYRTETKQYLNIAKQIEVKRDLLRNRFDFWENFVRKWEQRAINGVVSKKSNKYYDEL